MSPADEERGRDEQQDGLWAAQPVSEPPLPPQSAGSASPQPRGAPYPLHSRDLPARADPPGVGALDGGHGETDEEKHLPLFYPARGEPSAPLSCQCCPRTARQPG